MSHQIPYSYSSYSLRVRLTALALHLHHRARGTLSILNFISASMLWHVRGKAECIRLDSIWPLLSSLPLPGALPTVKIFVKRSASAELINEDSRCQILTYSLPCPTSSTRTNSPSRPPSWSYRTRWRLAARQTSPITSAAPWTRSTGMKSSSK